MPVYDMESIRKHRNVIQPGEPVYVSEKIHGCNARFCFRDGRFWVGSHRAFKKPDPNSWWWRIANSYSLEAKCKTHPGLVIYGEIFGNVQDLKYGLKGDTLNLVVFDLYDSVQKRFLDYADFVAKCDLLGLPRVPVLYTGPYDQAVVDPLSDGKTTMSGADHIREGIVIKPLVERRAHVGRVIFKLVGESYLLRKGGTEMH
jgi:RNA ligase (TIGR02306 family)